MIIDELFEGPQLCPECGGISFSDLILAEKKDACYYKVKASAKVWPSAYASGRLVQCRKKGAANYGKSKNESVAEGMDKLYPFERTVIDYMQDNSWLSAERAYFRYIGLQKKKQMSRSAWEEEIQRFIDLYNKYKGQPGVAEEQELDEKWSEKYKKSINCANPRGFSQRAHCAGRKKNEDVAEAKKDDDKIAGRYDPDEYDAMVARVKKLAGLGPMKTVYDPAKRVYKNVPTAVQPKK